MSNIVIIGSGPAGVSAALYAARAGVQTTVLTKGPGALDRAELIQNYYACRTHHRCRAGTPGHRGCQGRGGWSSSPPKPWA